MGRNGWRPVGGQIVTRWAREVDPNAPLPEYPRPQLVRGEWINLNGLWSYAVTRGETPAGYEGLILVPFAIESSLSGVGRALLPQESLWYRRTFEVPSTWAGKHVLLHFGAVDWKAVVTLNGRRVGEHNGGYLPCSFDLTPLLREGDNELIVQVQDPTDTSSQARGKQTLRPGGILYTAVSGIWQTVWLEPIPDLHIDSVTATPDISTGTVSVQVTATAATPVSVSVRDGNRVVAEGSAIAGTPVVLGIPDPHLWSPDDPHLYDLDVAIPSGDAVSSYFGMRSFGIAKDEHGLPRLTLNDRVLFQCGVLDQGYWPDGLYTAPTDDALRSDVEFARRLGCNMIRKHMKVEPLRWYYHCDRLGMIVWQDMPSGGDIRNQTWLGLLAIAGVHLRDDTPESRRRLGRDSEEARRDFESELHQMVEHLKGETCIAAWTPFNEGWGQFDASAVAERVKRQDPSRLVNHASGWHDQGGGDMASVHCYILRLRSPRRTRGRSFVMDEFGGYSLLVESHLWRFKKGFIYRLFQSREHLLEAYKALIERQLKPLFSQGLSAAVSTQLTDVEQETNGLVTYDREVVKFDEDALRRINESLWHSPPLIRR